MSEKFPNREKLTLNKKTGTAEDSAGFDHVNTHKKREIYCSFIENRKKVMELKMESTVAVQMKERGISLQ